MTASEELLGAGADGISGNAGRDTAFLVAAVARVPLQGLVAAGGFCRRGQIQTTRFSKIPSFFLNLSHFSDLSFSRRLVGT